MKKIKLTRGKVALVDDKDFEWLNQFKWYFNSKYVARSQSHILMHRLIMGDPEGMEIDHINRNKLDNQRSNLRVVTHSQNHHNGHFQKNNTSGYKGVYWNKKDKKWVARIKVDGKPKFLGYYEDKKIAALAYNTASISYHGKFGSRNDLS